MKSLVVLLLFSSLLFSFNYNLNPIKITEGVYCFFGKLEIISQANAGNIVNTCYVQNKEGFVVIDSGPTFSYAEQAYLQMQKIAKLPVKYVINTHDHDDHWLGNSFYKSKGALLIGPQTYEQNVFAGMRTRMQKLLTKEQYEKTESVILDTIVNGNYTLQLGNITYEIVQPVSVAHTKGDLIIYLPQKKVLFAGDLVFNDRLTSLRDGSLIGSLEALDKIDGYRAKYIIGGHGYKVDANSTKHIKKYFLAIKKEVLKALDNDVDMEVIGKHVVLPEYQELQLYKILHLRNVLDAYRELELMEDEEE